MLQSDNAQLCTYRSPRIVRKSNPGLSRERQRCLDNQLGLESTLESTLCIVSQYSTPSHAVFIDREARGIMYLVASIRPSVRLSIRVSEYPTSPA